LIGAPVGIDVPAFEHTAVDDDAYAPPSSRIRART
jgi:hypothetical protein